MTATIQPALPMPADMERRLAGDPLLLLLDVDGTLAPIAPRPEYAAMPPETRQVLEDFVKASGAFVSILSGRAAGDAFRLVGVDGVWTIGNHGFEVRDPAGDVQVQSDLLAYEAPIAEAVVRAHTVAADIPGVVVEDKRWTASVHYRLAHPSSVPALNASVEEIARSLGLRLTHGKEVLELRPPVDVDKGTAALALAERVGAMTQRGSVFCAGDDRTDEDAFRVLRGAHPGAVTVRVGREAGRPVEDSVAEFFVDDTRAMLTLLQRMLEQRTSAERRQGR